MKKTLGVVAAATLAAMPVMGVFAEGGVTTGENAYTDKLSVTISKACTFSRGTSTVAPTGDAHIDGAANGTGTEAIGKWGTGTGETDTLSGTLAAGELDTNFGASNFVVACNNENGWKVTAAAGALNGLTTTTENIPLGTPAADQAKWSYTSSSSDEKIKQADLKEHTASADEIVAQSAETTPTAGRTFKVQYAVSVDHKLSAQTYEGTITYTFAQL